MLLRKHCCLAGSILAFLIIVAIPVRAQSSSQNEAILKRLDELEKQNSQLLQEIRSLRATLAQGNGAQPLAECQPVSERQEVSEHRIEELAQTKVESSQRFPIQLTGMALFNAFTNSSYGGGNQDPTTASLVSGARNSGASLRQSVLGLKFTGPQTFLGGTVSGSLYMDFFGGNAASLNHLLRLRMATVQLDWANTTFAVGQDKPIVSRREPNSLAQVGVSPLTGAGNPWLWQPQARIEQRFRLSKQTQIKGEAGIFQTAESGGPAASSSLRVEASRPAFEARLALEHRFGDNQSVEIAPVFHNSTSHAGGNSIASRLYGVDWLIKPSSKLEITGLFFRGQNFANLGALGGITLLPSGVAIPIHGSGGWLQFRYLATQKLSFDLYGGQQDDRNRDMLTGGIGKNQYYAVNAMYLLAPNVVSAFEFGQNRTTYLGVGNRLNNHYDLALAYLF